MCAFHTYNYWSGVTDGSRMVPQQGLGGQVLVGERRDFEERLAQEVASKAPNILFPSVLHFLCETPKTVSDTFISAITTTKYLLMPHSHHYQGNPTSMRVHSIISIPMA